jgi:hypothetical protein
MAEGQATPILAVQGFMYAASNFRPIILRGIDPNQPVLSVPSSVLAGAPDFVPDRRIASREGG